MQQYGGLPGLGDGAKDGKDLTLDSASDSGFITFYETLPPKDDERLIRLFDRNGFFSVHGQDAKLVAQQVFRTNSVLKYLGGKAFGSEARGLPSCVLSHAVAKSFLRDALTRRQMLIEIWEQEPRKSIFKLAKSASPGNTSEIEDFIYSHGNDQVSVPVAMAVRVGTKDKQKLIGVAFADATTREIGIAEFVDNDLFSNFESLLIQLGVKECIVPSDEQSTDYELTKLKDAIDHCEAVITERPRSEFSNKNVEQDLTRLVAASSSNAISNMPYLELSLAMSSTAALISYLSLLSDSSAYHTYKVRQHDLTQYMKLDASALRALNLMPSLADGANKSASLFGLLNQCKTAQGTRLLAQWLKQPLMNLAEIVSRQDLVEAFVDDAQARQSLRDSHLRVFPDLHRLAKRFQKKMAGLEDVVRVYQAVIKLPGLVAVLETVGRGSARGKTAVQKSYLDQLAEDGKALDKYVEMVEMTIDLAALEDHQFLIKTEYSNDLKNIKVHLDRVRNGLDAEFETVGAELGVDTEKTLHLEQHTVYGYCMRLTRTQASLLRNKKMIELTTQKNGVYFTTKTLQSLKDEFKELSSRYNSTQSGLVREVTEIAATYIPILERLNALIASLDVILSFAHVSALAPTPYVRPVLHDRGSGNVVLKNARHPCIEIQDEVNFIANDVLFIRGESEFQLITGPNMGGKSTYIRQIGVIALMAQTGCFVPCSEATLTIFDCILARVGAGDNMSKGVSTFMAEMLETATILKTATRDSLVILDELGRGTSTYDGYGLAWAISEYIAKEIRCFGLFATHFHELTALSEQISTVKNLKVTVHVDSSDVPDKNIGNAEQNDQITLLYKVEEGVSDQSFGLHVAELAHFPESVLRLAKRKAAELGAYQDDDAETSMTSDSAASTALLQAFVKDYQSRLASQASHEPTLPIENKLKVLRQSFASFRPRFESDPAICKVLASAAVS